MCSSDLFQFQIQPLIEVRVHDLGSIATIHHHPFHIVASDSESDQQRIVMGLGGSDLVFFRKTQDRVRIPSGLLWFRLGLLSEQLSHDQHS